LNQSIAIDLPSITTRTEHNQTIVNRTFLLTFLLFSSLLSIAQQHTLKKTKINKEITINVPTSLIPMSDQQRRQKYVSNREPIAMYTSEDGNIDFGINVNSSSWSSDDYELLRQFYRSGILNLYDDVDFYRDTLQVINGKTFISFEFRGTLYSKEGSFRQNQTLSKYVYICYTLKDDRVLLFNFSAPYALRNYWRPTADAMMNSIKFK
jgi:hypothetical protein